MKGIYFRKDRGQFWFKRVVDGRRVVVNLETGDYATAVVAASKLSGEIGGGGSDSPLSAEIEAFLSHRLTMNKYSRMSVATRRYTLNTFAKLMGDITPDQVTGEDLNDYYHSMRKYRKPATVQTYMNSVKAFFDWLVKHRKLRKTPFEGMEFEIVDAAVRMRFVEYHDFNRLIEDAPTDELKFIMFCGFHAGMRKNEIVNARPAWFDLQNRQINILSDATFRQKDREARRSVPMSMPFAEFLIERPDMMQAGYVIRPNEQCDGLYRVEIAKGFREYVRSAGFEWVTLHTMRHSYASHMVKAGVDIFLVASYLGDGVAVVQKHYVHLKPCVQAVDQAFPAGLRLLGSSGDSSEALRRSSSSL